MAEWLKRQTRIRASDLGHLFLYEGAGSNPAGVVGFAPFFIKFKRARNSSRLEHNGHYLEFSGKSLGYVTTMGGVPATRKVG